MAHPAPAQADRIPRRQLEKLISWTARERLRCLWYRLLMIFMDMNYATYLLVDCRVPGPADDPVERCR